MCQIFVRANAQSYEATTRSIRLHGVVTSVRLENLFWDTLEEIAQRDAMHVPQLLSKLYDELLDTGATSPISPAFCACVACATWPCRWMSAFRATSAYRLARSTPTPCCGACAPTWWTRTQPES